MSQCAASAMPEPTAPASGFSNFPAWVLLYTVAKLGRCKNDETTARGTTSDGVPIEVSFELVDPPGLSRCIVDCPDLTASSDSTSTAPHSPSASVTGADGAFLLIRVCFPERDDRWIFTDVFVYRAGPQTTPSLNLLPRPYPLYLHSNNVGVLSCGGGCASDHCLVVVPECQTGPDRRLHVFSTKTQSWSTKDPRVGCAADGLFHPTKVFSVAGGSLAWVDVQSRILLCKEVDDDPEMLVIQLPPLMGTNVQEYGVDSFGCEPSMDPIRDVTFRDGRFMFFEMESALLFVSDDSDSTSQGQGQWTAAMFERKVSSENWEWCCNVASDDLVPSDSCFSHLFPEIYDSEEKKLTLNRVISFLPTLDQYHDGVVYMISKLDARDKHGWILAVDTENKTLQKAVPFSSETTTFDYRGYLQCAFSKYLSKGAG